MESLTRYFFSDVNRRQFLKHSTAATLAALTGSAPRLLGSEAGKRIEPSADTLILLWMAGGMAQTETFDPKAYTPYESGLESKRVLSTFPSIPTAVDGINLSQGLERLASVMDRGTLIRSHRVGDLGFILHSRHQFHWHTGYEPPQSVAVPHLGAFISRTLGPKNPDVPAFIDIGQNLEIGAESDSLKAFHTAGFLGTEYGPFFISDPRDAVASTRPPAHISAVRFRQRHERYRQLVQAARFFNRAATINRNLYCDRSRMPIGFSIHQRPKLSIFRSSRRRSTTPTTPVDLVSAAFWQDD
jgi:Protein of unknown function (DUF1501)/TAT (twin-arginine translocation) pathway signal sequence